MKKFTIVTLYPELLKPYTDGAILGRAQKKKAISIDYLNLRDFGLGKYRQVDDTPYGGGPGMILRADVAVPAIEKARGKKGRVILLSPTGRQFSQETARDLSREDHIVLVCGRFEGVDERVKKYIDDEISVGPYVTAGGELPALTILESIARLLPGVLGNPTSAEDESFTNNALEYPQYTKPAVYRELKVPEVLQSGDHRKIKAWRVAHQKRI